MTQRIEIICSDAGTLVTFQVAFRDAGYQVHVADCGRAALDVLTRTVPDAILLDLRLGDISGYDVLLWMRAHDITGPTAVVTGFGQFFDRIEASALGAAIYVEKPLWLDDAFWIVECLTAKSRRHDAVGAVARATPNRTLSAALLHARILSGDTAALERLEDNMLASLPHRLRHAFPRVAMDVNFEAVEDAILEYALHPERFDPSRGTPFATHSVGPPLQSGGVCRDFDGRPLRMKRGALK
jgi:DNA-binding response OmpR family regulator